MRPATSTTITAISAPPLHRYTWNEVYSNVIGTSIDPTCTIKGLETLQVMGHVNVVSGHVKTRLIAHDKEVFDIAFFKAGGGRDMFTCVGANVYMRMFDLTSSSTTPSSLKTPDPAAQAVLEQAGPKLPCGSCYGCSWGDFAGCECFLHPRRAPSTTNAIASTASPGRRTHQCTFALQVTTTRP